MAADILLYDAELVPVGKDQMQHLRSRVTSPGPSNRTYGDDMFVVPMRRWTNRVMIVPGTDGQKMSKSYGNVINVSSPTTNAEEAGDGHRQRQQDASRSRRMPTTTTRSSCSLLAASATRYVMREHYLRSNYGYGHAKKELLHAIMERWKGPTGAVPCADETISRPNWTVSCSSVRRRRIPPALHFKRVRERVGYLPALIAGATPT